MLVWWNLGLVVGLPGFGGFGLGLEGSEGEDGVMEGGLKKWFKAGKTTASACTAIAYAAGLMCGWGTIWGLETVVFGDYQRWGMRVRRRLKVKGGVAEGEGKDGKGTGVVVEGKHGKLRNGPVDVDGIANGNTNTITNGSNTAANRQQSKSERNGIKRGSWGPDTIDLRRRNRNISSSWESADTGYGKVASPTSSIKSTETQQGPGDNHESKGQRWTVDETVDLDKYEYYWEPYPDQGTIWERLDWVMDMFNSFRGAGKFVPSFHHSSSN